ncbi:hypothetical protein [Burkholderia sp. Bp9004]|uniref:hypothetical protein n=1 Tax=Burkholderia sp. Bp9004 TaxID=2184559 RepID=UPI000F5F8D6E|nr:hypothetical protein [Burkholderia sp. Bp9004]RQZ57302.1 hypothetical protein DIE08_34940 [Burkholderia sp. Bp9004]
MAIPSNLASLHNHEEAIRADSLSAIAADVALSDHLQAVHDALDHLTVLVGLESEAGDDRHTIQLLVIRLFNIGASTVKLGLSGYYQQAFQLLRDALELVNLIDLFRADGTKIAAWRTADNKKLKKVFGPAAVREVLEKLPQYKGQKAGRDKLYAMFSEHAAHTTYQGFSLVSPRGSPHLGPFLDVTLLKALLEEIGPHLAHATIGLSTLFESDLPLVILEAKAAYIEQLRQYHDKYIRNVPPMASENN